MIEMEVFPRCKSCVWDACFWCPLDYCGFCCPTVGLPDRSMLFRSKGHVELLSETVSKLNMPWQTGLMYESIEMRDNLHSSSSTKWSSLLKIAVRYCLRLSLQFSRFVTFFSCYWDKLGLYVILRLRFWKIGICSDVQPIFDKLHTFEPSVQSSRYSLHLVIFRVRIADSPTAQL